MAASSVLTDLLRCQRRGEAPLKDALLDRITYLPTNTARTIAHFSIFWC